jgi:hypothetical protein
MRIVGLNLTDSLLKKPTFNAEPAEIAENPQEKDSAVLLHHLVFNLLEPDPTIVVGPRSVAGLPA